jgi:hypothetical protein
MRSIVPKFVAAAVLVGTAALSVRSAIPAEPVADPWKSLRFLLGTWDAKTLGGSAKAAAAGTYSFRLEMKDHVLARHSGREKCEGPADFNCQHDDLLYVYQETPGQSYEAIYFDNEGHIIHYDVSVPSASTAIFLSDHSHPGPQFRLTYALSGGLMNGKFQMRMPGQTEFTSYLEWSGTKLE